MGGLAELFSGMVSMGLGAYLAAVTERDTYASQEQRAACLPAEQRAEVHSILERYGVSRAAAAPLVDELCADERHPPPTAPGSRGLTMGLSYFVGGLIPMIPYFLLDNIREALVVSVAVTVVILLGFGYVKNYVAIRNHRAGAWGALQTLVIGVLAAGTSYVIVKSLDRGET
ncbi:Protein ccc1 [Metarhizium acridum]|nr:Protein ccc1 [Metarhizium acridum]